MVARHSPLQWRGNFYRHWNFQRATSRAKIAKESEVASVEVANVAVANAEVASVEVANADVFKREISPPEVLQLDTVSLEIHKFDVIPTTEFLSAPWQGKWGLQVLLVIPFLLQITAAVGITAWLSLQNGQKAIQNLAQQLMESTSQRVGQRLESYLTIPVRINQENRRFFSQDLPFDDPERLQQWFWSQAKNYPELGYVSYTQTNGAFLGVGRWLDGSSLVVDEITMETPGWVRTHRLNSGGEKTTLLFTNPYSPQQEDWYTKTISAQQEIWSLSFEEDLAEGSMASIGMSLNLPLYTNSGQLKGVIGADLLLPAISDYLRELNFSPKGHVFILERNGFLIGSSSLEPIVKVSDRGKASRLSLANTQDPLVQELAQVIQTQFQGLGAIQSAQAIAFHWKNQRYFLRLKPWRDGYGLDWIVAIVVPESDFMAEIHANTRTTLALCSIALLVATLLGLYTARRIATPILQLRKATQAIAAGNLRSVESTTLPSVVREIEDLNRSFQTMAEQLQESFRTLNYRAQHDSLTGLLNRDSFRSLLNIYLQNRQNQINSGQSSIKLASYAILFLDLDYFKLINDSLGHLLGDRLLIDVTKRLQHCIRKNDVFARFGGDEFVLMLTSSCSIQNAAEVAQRLLDSLKRPFLLGEQEIFIDASIGIVMGDSSNDADELLRSADAALYRAKASGRGRYELFDHQMHADVMQRLRLETDLRYAIEKEDFQVYYQPIVDTKTRKIKGLEALLRWQHPQRGWISPASFIPVAEETGLIIKLGWWVLEKACLQLRNWHIQFSDLYPIAMSVNVSGKQFLQSDFVQIVQQILKRTDLSPKYLKLEITESLLMHHETMVQARLNQLQDLGIEFSIDDFGTGYSSLSYLHRFPIKTLKIDRSFIHQMNLEERNEAIVETIITLARRMNMNVIAEGVEEEEQRQHLQRLGCEMFQGFLISHPLESAGIEAMLSKMASEYAMETKASEEDLNIKKLKAEQLRVAELQPETLGIIPNF